VHAIFGHFQLLWKITATTRKIIENKKKARAALLRPELRRAFDSGH
jgi:hypothetical protein